MRHRIGDRMTEKWNVICSYRRWISTVLSHKICGHSVFDQVSTINHGSYESAPGGSPGDSAEGLDPAYDEAFAGLAQIIAHRIRSLTSSIESCADMLSDVVDGRDERELVLRILEGTARIEYVLSDLMLYGKPIHPTYLPLYVDDVLHGVLSLLSEGERRLIEPMDGLSDDIQISADPRLLRQALLAVVQNAIDAVDPENDASASVRIDTRTDVTDDTVTVAVTNPGATGLEDARERIFRPFFTTKAQNLGLGLSIARRIVDVHGGSLHLVSDDPARGTRFEMTLPVER